MGPWIDRVLLACGAERRLARRHADALCVLMYHGIVERALAPFCWHQLPAAAFEQQMAWVARHRTVLPLEEALERLQAGTLPPRATAITFDDGYRNNRTRALPILEAHDLCATIFLVTDRVGPDARLWPDRLWRAFRDARTPRLDTGVLGLGTLDTSTVPARGRAYGRVCHALKAIPVATWPARHAELIHALDPAADGAPDDEAFALLDEDDLAALAIHERITLAPHSRTHPILSQCSDEQVRDEIAGSCQAIERRVGRAPRVFAYPNGRSIDFDGRARHALQAEGMPFALSTEPGLVTTRSDALALPRLSVGADLGFARFRLLLAGWGA